MTGPSIDDKSKPLLAESKDRCVGKSQSCDIDAPVMSWCLDTKCQKYVSGRCFKCYALGKYFLNAIEVHVLLFLAEEDQQWLKQHIPNCDYFVVLVIFEFPTYARAQR